MTHRQENRSKGSQRDIRLPSTGVLYQEDELPEHLALKISGAFFQEFQKAGGNRHFTFKGCTQYALGPRVEAVI